MRRLVSVIGQGRHFGVTTALYVVLVVCMLAPLTTVTISVAGAETPISVQGKMVWDLDTLQIIDSVAANGNTILWGATTVYVTGDFAGTATDSWRETLFRTGALGLWDVMTIPTTVDGKSGTLMMLLVGRAAPPGSYWTGEWVILSATDGLADLRGVGTWWTADVGYDFSGEVHFA